MPVNPVELGGYKIQIRWAPYYLQFLYEDHSKNIGIFFVPRLKAPKSIQIQHSGPPVPVQLGFSLFTARLCRCVTISKGVSGEITRMAHCQWQSTPPCCNAFVWFTGRQIATANLPVPVDVDITGLVDNHDFRYLFLEN